jgi:hypothetical protein
MSPLSVRQSTDDVRTVTGAPCLARYIKDTLTDQRVKLTIKLGSTTDQFAGIMARDQSNRNGYLVEWDTSVAAINLYRVTNGDTASPTFTLLAQSAGSDANINTTYTGAYLKATGTSPVLLDVGDDINGASRLTFSDSNAARWQTGQPGLSEQTNTAFGFGEDDVEVWDEASAGVPPLQYKRRLAIQQRTAA